MPDKKNENPSMVITFTIDTAMKLNTNGQRFMAVSVVARQGDAGQVSRFEMTNWKTDLPAEIDRLMRLLLDGSLALPDFPDMSEKASTAQISAKPDTIPEGDEEPTLVEDVGAVEPEPEASVDEGDGYEISLYPATDAAGEVSPSQPDLF